MNWLLRNGMRLLLALSAWLARDPRRRALSQAWSDGLARRAIARGGIGPAATAAALGEMWQRAFLSRKHVPVTRISDDTAFAEIRTPCPLRGSGDTQACWRMMAFDRRVAEAAGGEFIVLRSQAEPGVSVCEVALRLRGAQGEPLLAAHQRAPGGRA